MAWVIWRRGSTNNRGNRAIFGLGSSATGGTGEPGSGSFGSGPNWVPRDVVIGRSTIYQNVQEGGVKHLRLKRGNDIDLHDPPLTVSGVAISEDETLNVTCPELDPTSDATITTTQNYCNEWTEGVPAVGGAVNIAFEAEADGDPDIEYHCYGQSGVGGVTIGASDRWGMIVGGDSGEASESAAQLPWPVTGTLKEFSVVWENLTAANSADFALRINGADVIVFTVTGNGATRAAMMDMVSEIDIEEGDLVCWRVLRTAGADTTVSIIITFGFTTK